ncbi:hypothetical protein HJG53_00960 [Sphingomonas sp. ID1715]|uniref:hypothetical protein n=1 Tax=Sphingomonas sp. ID1715 TaxID=1656898 RepID=UPI001487701F|nr:hypothetical protein [Sphingomonas sp. ID1715]NNM75478.1 hypothetical protein [Sphingomonas sp. ID1715]
MNSVSFVGFALLCAGLFFFISGIRTGEIWAAKVHLKLSRRHQPVLFWFTAAVFLLLVGVGVVFLLNPLGL